ncbi:hypothetical protein NDI49_34040, partial [Trichocoleus sp. ST-U3]
ANKDTNNDIDNNFEGQHSGISQSYEELNVLCITKCNNSHNHTERWLPFWFREYAKTNKTSKNAGCCIH